jgi:three-Cys-motif partner protein
MAEGGPQRLGSKSTEIKQDIVVNYLQAYASALRNQRFHLSYIDAFCGSGKRLPRSAASSPTNDLFSSPEDHAPRPSTAIQALHVEPPFDRYVFGDKNGRHLAQLRGLVEDLLAARSGTPPDVQYRQGDANALVTQECAWLRGARNRRAVMFLDPFGMQVDWATLEAIKMSGVIDLWLLVPTAMGVTRLLPWTRSPRPEWLACLDRFLGDPGWRSALGYSGADLLGDETVRRTVELGRIETFILARLRTLFGQGLHQTSLPLDARGRPAYLLVFACTSSNPRAIAVAHRIAGHLLDRTTRR